MALEGLKTGWRNTLHAHAMLAREAMHKLLGEKGHVFLPSRSRGLNRHHVQPENKSCRFFPIHALNTGLVVAMTRINPLSPKPPTRSNFFPAARAAVSLGR
jgi:hypothetical protein